MAHQTRSQRRARRAAQAESAGAVQRARSRQAAVRPAAQPIKSQGGRRAIPGGGGKQFVSESIAELRKVEWPGRSQLIQATIVVLIACFVVGVYLYVNDRIWQPVVHRLLNL